MIQVAKVDFTAFYCIFFTLSVYYKEIKKN